MPTQAELQASVDAYMRSIGAPVYVPPAPPVPNPVAPLPAPAPPPPGPIPAYNPVAGLPAWNTQAMPYYAAPAPAPSYNTATGVTTLPPITAAPKTGQVDNAKVLEAGGAKLDNPYELDLTTNGLGVLLQTAAAQLDPGDISDPTKARAILVPLGATDAEIRDLSYAGVRYDSELQSVNGVPQYTRVALNKIATLRVLDSGRVVPAASTNTGRSMTAGEYYWRQTLPAYQSEQAAKLNAPGAVTPLPKLPVRAPAPTGSSGTVLTILAIGAAVLALS